MASGLQLEEFSAPGATDPAAAAPAPEALEEARLAGYEQGFRAGWDDAVTAQKDAETGARAELAARIEELSFGYHEAQQHILSGLAPLIEALLAHVLPAVGRETLCHRLLEVLMPLAREQADQPLRLRLHPSCRAPMDEVLATAAAAPPLVIEEDPTLPPGAAALATGAAEQLFDSDRIIETLTALVREHLLQAQAPTREEQRYG